MLKIFKDKKSKSEHVSVSRESCFVISSTLQPFSRWSVTVEQPAAGN